MAYYSKYSGKEVDERLDRVDSIPTKISQLLNDKDYITEIELKAILDKIPIVDFSKIPIDEDTIYWSENSDGKLVLKSKGGGEDSNWSVKKDSNGNKYIYTELPVVTQYGVTMYGNSGDVYIEGIYDGIPLDYDTIIKDENGIIKINPDIKLGGISSWNDITDKPTWITTNKPKWDYNEDLYNKPDLSKYVDIEELKKYVTISGNESIEGIKDFLNGLKINGSSIYKSQEDVIYIDANLAVRGTITMLATDSVDIPSIIDVLPVAGNEVKGIASFDSRYFIVNNGKVELIEGNIGLNKEELDSYLNENRYVTETWVLGKSYALNSDLTLLATKVNNFLEGSDTDTIINKWKELEAFLSGLSESDNLAEILETKANKSYVDSTFITIAGSEDVTGIHDFKNGLKVGGMKLSKSQDDVVYLDGNLVVRGGLTMYALDDVTVDSIIDKLPTASTNSKGVASFDEDDFTIEDGHVSLNDERLSSELSELKDVEVLNPQNNESLVYNSETAKWENKVVDSDKTFYYEQQTSSDTWSINHNLSKKPSVMVFDSANDEVNGDIIYNDNNNITLRFSAPFSGIAILN